VKKKIVSVLQAWHRQFRDDPGMSYVAGLIDVVRPDIASEARRRRAEEEARKRQEAIDIKQAAIDKEAAALARDRQIGNDYQLASRIHALDKRKAEVEKAKRDEEDRKAAKKLAKEEARRKTTPAPAPKAAKAAPKAEPAKGKVPKRKWDYEKEKPLILQSIATASQATSNLVNAITVRAAPPVNQGHGLTDLDSS
jgi:cell division protein FtsN